MDNSTDLLLSDYASNKEEQLSFSSTLTPHEKSIFNDVFSFTISIYVQYIYVC
jgi:hypothetical protein